MARLAAPAAIDFRQAPLEPYAVNEGMNQILLGHLDPGAWRAQPPGRKGRTVAAIFAHVHKIRRKWLRLSAPHLKSPPPLDRARCTPKQANVALAESAARCAEMLAQALAGSDGRVRKFRLDGWARRWPVGAAMFTYMVSHDAHHRGKVCMLARQLGLPLPVQAGSRIWNWERLWRECGFTHPR